MYSSDGFEADSLEELQSKMIERYEEEGWGHIPSCDITYIMHYESDSYLSESEILGFLSEADEIMSNNKRERRGCYEYF